VTGGTAGERDQPRCPGDRRAAMRTGSAVPCIAAALLGLWLVGCPGDSGKGGPATNDTLSTRQRDSVIGASRLPGAAGVRKALELSDSARARAARLDTMGGR